VLKHVQASAAIFQRRQTMLNFQNISYMMSELVHGGRIDDVWGVGSIFKRILNLSLHVGTLS
jgi:hypothetical protein